jgi:hypothetical protein
MITTDCVKLILTLLWKSEFLESPAQVPLVVKKGYETEYQAKRAFWNTSNHKNVSALCNDDDDDSNGKNPH